MGLLKSGRVKTKNKKGCWSTLWPGLLTILIALVIGIILFLSHFLSGGAGLEKYATLLQELENTPTDIQMAPEKITTADKDDYQSLILDFMASNESEPLFDDLGNFIVENIQPEKITILSGASLVLDKTSLACFIQSCLGAGWVSETYEEGENMLELLQITSLETSDNTTTITAVFKLKLASLFDGATEEEMNTLSVLGSLPENLYFVYTANFDYSEEEKNLSSTMWVNQLTSESNDLLLELIFDNLLEENELPASQNLNFIMEWVLDEFERVLELWDCPASFSGEGLTITKN